jgi:hypothetical protein
MPMNDNPIEQLSDEWIATAEQLPDAEGMLLFWVSYICDPVVGTVISEPKLGWFTRVGTAMYFETTGDRPDRYELDEVSHWMPLSPPPGKRFI